MVAEYTEFALVVHMKWYWCIAHN